MGKKVMSARGVWIDFDLPQIKNQILKTPKTDDIKKRERFIDKKRRRASRNTVDQLLGQQAANEAMVREALARQETLEKQEAVVKVALIQQAKNGEGLNIPVKLDMPAPEDPHAEDVETTVIKPIKKK